MSIYKQVPSAQYVPVYWEHEEWESKAGTWGCMGKTDRNEWMEE